MLETNLPTDNALQTAGQKLLDSAYEYWQEYQRSIGNSAVVYLKDTNGRMVVFTRGEYREALMENIESVLDETRF
jgi:hypothetical protein